MKCKDAMNVMSDYLDDGVSIAVRLDFEAHIRECSACRSELAAMRCLLASLNGLSGKKSPVDCWTSIRTQIYQCGNHKKSWVYWALRPWVAAPTVFAAVAIVGVLMWPHSIDEPVGPNVSNILSASEYSQYIGAHSRVQRQQVFTDPDVKFIAAELETANVPGDPD